MFSLCCRQRDMCGRHTGFTIHRGMGLKLQMQVAIRHWDRTRRDGAQLLWTWQLTCANQYLACVLFASWNAIRTRGQSASYFLTRTIHATELKNKNPMPCQRGIAHYKNFDTTINGNMNSPSRRQALICVTSTQLRPTDTILGPPRQVPYFINGQLNGLNKMGHMYMSMSMRMHMYYVHVYVYM